MLRMRRVMQSNMNIDQMHRTVEAKRLTFTSSMETKTSTCGDEDGREHRLGSRCAGHLTLCAASRRQTGERVDRIDTSHTPSAEADGFRGCCCFFGGGGGGEFLVGSCASIRDPCTSPLSAAGWDGPAFHPQCAASGFLRSERS